MFKPAQTAINILLVDDDDVAVEGVQRSLAKSDVNFNITTAGDGLEALQILRGEHPEKTVSPPMLVLLDLNMPLMDGLEFLAVIRDDDILHSTVVFVLTTSSRDCDRSAAYQKHIAGYMVKSVVGPQFAKLSELLTSFSRSVNLPAE
jgi:CheY-like chemotaxis protein